MNYEIKSKQQGSVILFSIFMIAIMITSTLALARVFGPKLRSAYEAVNSGVAIFAADTASELCLYEARKQPAELISRTLLTNGATFKIASLSATPLIITDDCRILGRNYFTFRASGIYRGMARSLEVTQ